MGLFYDGGASSFLDDDEKKREQLFGRIEGLEDRISGVGQELPEPERERNLLLSALDILDRPRNAVVSGLAGKGFWKGLTGKEHVNVSDLIGDSVENKYLKTGLGFVGDVLLDPLTYVTFGAAGAAKGAAQQGARKFLKFAGQEMADVTPLANALGAGLQKTGIPEIFGPVFNSGYVRRAVTSTDELPDVQQAIGLMDDARRLISGQQQDAIDEAKRYWAGIKTPEAAASAAHIMEAPTLMRKPPLDPIPKQKVTVRREPAQGINEMLSPAIPTQSTMPIEDALSMPAINSIAGVKTSVDVPTLPGIGRALPEADNIMPQAAFPAVGVSVPQTLVEDAGKGVLDRSELNRVLAGLKPEQQKQLLDEIRIAIQNKLPAPVRRGIKEAEIPKAKHQGEAYTEKELIGFKQQVEKEIAGMKKGTASYLREGMKEAQKEGDIWRKVKEKGGISPHAKGFLREEYKSVPLGLRNKNGLPIDEMASELNMTANELMDVITNRKPLKAPTMAEAIAEAERYLRFDKDYQAALRAVAKLEELLTKLEPGELPDAIRSLLPKVSSPDDLAKPEVISAVKSLMPGQEGHKRIIQMLRSMESNKLTGPVSGSATARTTGDALATPTPKPTELKLSASDANVAFEKKPAAAELPEQTATIPEMFKAAKKAGIKISPESRAAAIMARKMTEQTASKDAAAGVAFDELPNYVRHLYKDPPEKVQTVLTEWMKKRANMPGKMAGFQKERKVPTLAEAKRLGLTPIEDVRILTTVRELEGIQQRAINGMYQQMERLGGNVMRKIEDAPAGWKSIAGVKHLEGKAVHPEVARHLDRFNSIVNTDDGIKTFMSTLNTVQNFWKGLVTAPNPMFHVRNAIGNFYNNFLAGVVDPQVYGLAAIAQKGGSEIFDMAGKKYTGKQLRTLFRENGLEGMGIFKGESTNSMVKQATEAFEKQPMLTPIKGGRKIGDWIESNAKMAHFIDRMVKGDSVKEAAESVRKHLFDYSDLTTAEKKIRNFVPFYTWTRKNIPLQLESLITKPGKMTAYNKLVENSRKSQGVEEGDMPGWMKSELALSIGNNKHLLLDLPVTQLNLLAPGSNMKNLVGMLSPLIKVPIEQAMGKQIFSGQPIEKYPGATVPFGNVQLPAHVAYALSQLGPMPRTAAQISGSFVDQQPNSSYIPGAPKQIPGMSSFIREVDPKREKLLAATRRERQLQDLKRYLEEVKGIDIPTATKKSNGLFY